MKLALSQGQESQRAFQGGTTRQRPFCPRTGEEQAAGVSAKLAQAVRLGGEYRSDEAGGDHKLVHDAVREGGGSEGVASRAFPLAPPNNTTAT